MSLAHRHTTVLRLLIILCLVVSLLVSLALLTYTFSSHLGGYAPFATGSGIDGNGVTSSPILDPNGVAGYAGRDPNGLADGSWINPDGRA